MVTVNRGTRTGGQAWGPSQGWFSPLVLQQVWGAWFLGRRMGRLSVQQSPGWLTTGKLSQGTGCQGSPSCSLSTELGVPQITAALRPQILGEFPVFGPGLRESAGPSLALILPHSLDTSMPCDVGLSKGLSSWHAGLCLVGPLLGSFPWFWRVSHPINFSSALNWPGNWTRLLL